MIRVGLASWTDAALITEGSFYPRKSMTAEQRLRYYASVFETVEVNASYYAIPNVRTVRDWVARTPPNFVFHVKAWSLLTGHHPRAETVPADLQRLLPPHPARTRRGEVEARMFPPAAFDAALQLFRAALGPLAEAGKLGYVLFQMAPWVRYSPAQLDDLAALPARVPGWTIAVELRDRSWFPDHAAETLRVLRQAGLAHVVVDAPPVPNAIPFVTAVTAPVAVMRFHGRNSEGWLRQLHGGEPAVREKYDYLYTEDELRGVLPDVQRLAAEAETVDIVFNNNNRDYPVRNALMMRKLLGSANRPPGGLPVDRPA